MLSNSMSKRSFDFSNTASTTVIKCTQSLLWLLRLDAGTVTLTGRVDFMVYFWNKFIAKEWYAKVLLINLLLTWRRHGIFSCPFSVLFVFVCGCQKIWYWLAAIISGENVSYNTEVIGQWFLIPPFIISLLLFILILEELANLINFIILAFSSYSNFHTLYQNLPICLLSETFCMYSMYSFFSEHCNKLTLNFVMAQADIQTKSVYYIAVFYGHFFLKILIITG